MGISTNALILIRYARKPPVPETRDTHPKAGGQSPSAEVKIEDIDTRTTRQYQGCGCVTRHASGKTWIERGRGRRRPLETMDLCVQRRQFVVLSHDRRGEEGVLP